jgi:hypothetical protein
MKEVMNKNNTYRKFQNSSASQSGSLVLNLGNKTFIFIGFLSCFTIGIYMSSASTTESSNHAPGSTMKEGGNSSY